MNNRNEIKKFKATDENMGNTLGNISNKLKKHLETLKKSECGGMQAELSLCVGARVMLEYNRLRATSGRVPIVGGNTNPSQIRNISTTKYDKTIVGEIREFYVPYSLFADDGADLPYRFITAVQMLFTLDDAFWILETATRTCCNPTCQRETKYAPIDNRVVICDRSKAEQLKQSLGKRMKSADEQIVGLYLIIDMPLTTSTGRSLRHVGIQKLSYKEITIPNIKYTTKRMKYRWRVSAAAVEEG
ncbi:unnamed protein product [Sphagnum balticum]